MAHLRRDLLRGVSGQSGEAPIRDGGARDMPQELQDLHGCDHLHHRVSARARVLEVLQRGAGRRAVARGAGGDIRDAQIEPCGVPAQRQEQVQDPSRLHQVPADRDEVHPLELHEQQVRRQASERVPRRRGGGAAELLRRGVDALGPAQRREQARVHHLDEVPDLRQPVRGRGGLRQEGARRHPVRSDGVRAALRARRDERVDERRPHHAAGEPGGFGDPGDLGRPREEALPRHRLRERAGELLDQALQHRLPVQHRELRADRRRARRRPSGHRLRGARAVRGRRPCHDQRQLRRRRGVRGRR